MPGKCKWEAIQQPKLLGGRPGHCVSCGASNDSCKRRLFACCWSCRHWQPASETCMKRSDMRVRV